MQTTIEVEPRAPFDFELSLRFLIGFPATKNEQVITQNRLIKGLRVSGAMAVADLVSTGTTDQPCLSLTIYSDTLLTTRQIQDIESRLRFMLSIDEDIAAFHLLAAQDAPFQETVIPALYGYRQVKFPSPFENAVWAILAQRRPIVKSRQMKQALMDKYSQRIKYEEWLFEGFPQPEDFFPLDRRKLADCIGNELKASYLIEVIEAFSTIENEFLPHAPYDEVKRWLMDIKGIGEWSALFVLARGLGRMQQALLADPSSTFNKRLLSAAVPIYGNISFGELREIAEQYGAWQGYWAHFLKAYTEVMGGGST